MAGSLTDVVTVKRALTASPVRANWEHGYGPYERLEPGQRLLVWKTRQNRTVGGTVYMVGIPAHDSYLGEYITDHSKLFAIMGDALDWIEVAPVIG